MNNLKLKLSMLLCLLALGLGSVSAQDAAGFKPVELRTGVNNEGTPLSHKSLNNSGSGKITYSGGYESSYPRYNYNLTLGYQGARNYAYELFTFQQSVPAYSRLRLTLRNTWIHQYNLSYTTNKVASASTFTVFETEKSARETYLIANPSTTPYSNPGDGQLYIHVYNPGDKYNVTSARVSKVSYFDNKSGSAQRTITKWAVLATYSAYGNGTRRAYLLVETMNGAYVDKNYDYYKHITFNANGGTGTMTQQTVENSAALSANTFTREGFTFAGWNTKADGTGTQYAAGAQITATAADKGLVTLYAQWTAEPITATFDYTYRTSVNKGGVETYEHMEGDHESAAITNKVLAILKDHNGAALKSVVLTAGEATTPEGTPTSSIATHKTASLTLNVAKGTEEGVANEGSNYTVTLSATNYSNYRSVDFEVLTNGSTQESQTKAPHWEPLKQNATSYLFKYEGHSSANMFDLTWTVSLKNLSMYPSHIFVKPMRKATQHDEGQVVNLDLEQIPAMVGMDGEVCELAGYIKATDDSITIAAYNGLSDEEKKNTTITGAYYKGEYRVLKTCSHGKDYKYQLGLTGFTIDGNTYYLSANEGDIPSDMVSTAVASSVNVNINFDRAKEDIPVLILQPGTGATVNGQSGYLLYVDNNQTRTVNLEQFLAVRPNYTFVGWKDAYDNNTVYAFNGNYHFNMGTKATTTLNAQWVRTNAPEIENSVKVSNNCFVYTVTVTDELNQVRDVKYCYAQSSETAPESANWEDLVLTDGVGKISLSTLNDKFGKHLWVKASNGTSDTDGKTAYAYLGEVRSVFNVTANPNPDSRKEEKFENGTWEKLEVPTEDGQEYEFKPNGTYTTVTYYDHYSTFYFSNRSFKVYDATVYTANLVDGSKLELKKIKPTEENAPVVIPQSTAVILRKVQTEVNDNIIELEECEEAEYNGETNSLEGTDDIASHQTGKKYYIFSYAQNGLGFYLNSKTSLAAHKAYICIEGESKIRAFTLNFGEDDPITVAIHEIETTGKTSVTYDLSGRKVNDGGTHGGIYVKSGSKLLKK